MSQRERHAWHRFREVMAKRQAEFDGQVPAALVCVAVCHGGDECHGPGDDESVNVHLHGTLAILRPPGLTHEQVADLFERAAAQIRAGQLRCR